MPSGIHVIELDIPIQNIWDFISQMDKWAPLVPGYVEHKVINDKQSTWKFKADIGVMQKTVSLKIDITEWLAPTMVAFNLTERSGNFSGKGYFEAVKQSDKETKMTGYLQVTANGMMGPMMNKVMKSFVQKNTKELTEAIAHNITEMESVRI